MAENLLMKLSEELAYRGFINQTTYPDISVLDDKSITFYHGFDASADSQTIGNLAGMMLDRLFMKHGHKAVILAGGATSLIGDPGGKDTERPMQSEETIAHNITKAEEQLRLVLSGYDFKLVNNLEWTKDLTVIRFLRDIGKCFSMTPLIQREYIARRLGEGGSGISYTEFSYTLLQGMDYLHLFDTEGVTLQIGSSDQWGNILSGVELIRKTHEQEVHGLTAPLIINKATGKKFGKSEEGAIWLDGNKTTPFKFYQFWLNIDDKGVEDYLKIYTELSKEEIENILSEFQRNPGARAAQKKLAYEVTKIVHGEDQSQKQRRVTEALFGGELEDLDEAEVATIREEFPNLTVPAGMPILDILISTELAKSNSEARRLKDGGAIYVNNEKFGKDHLEAGDFQNKRLLIRRGKAFKDSALIELQ
jgi:tyrosyl-tRNA synthetase